MKKKLMILFGILAILFLQACMENFDEGSGRASTQAFSEPYLTEDSGGDFEKYQGVRMIKEQQYNPWAVTKTGAMRFQRKRRITFITRIFRRAKGIFYLCSWI